MVEREVHVQLLPLEVGIPEGLVGRGARSAPSIASAEEVRWYGVKRGLHRVGTTEARPVPRSRPAWLAIIWFVGPQPNDENQSS